MAPYRNSLPETVMLPMSRLKFEKAFLTVTVTRKVPAMQRVEDDGCCHKLFNLCQDSSPKLLLPGPLTAAFESFILCAFNGPLLYTRHGARL